MTSRPRWKTFRSALSREFADNSVYATQLRHLHKTYAAAFIVFAYVYDLRSADETRTFLPSVARRQFRIPRGSVPLIRDFRPVISSRAGPCCCYSAWTNSRNNVKKYRFPRAPSSVVVQYELNIKAGDNRAGSSAISSCSRNRHLITVIHRFVYLPVNFEGLI